MSEGWAEGGGKSPPTTSVVGGLRDAPSAHRWAWLSLDRLLFSDACLRLTRIGCGRIRAELPAPSSALDEMASLELAECVDDALRADS